MACPRCRADNPDDARFCGHCGASLAEACPACGATLAGGQRFCRGCGRERTAAVPEPAPRPAAPSPVADDDGERRQATVVFADLVGYTALTEARDPEDVEALVGRIKAEATRVFERHGGTVNQFVGDEVMALFGVPLARRDDARHAVEAALQLHAAVDALMASAHSADAPLSLHTGIASGLVVARKSDTRAGAWLLTGDAVNTAARLRSAAAPGAVVVDAETWAQVGERFEAEAGAPLELKGKERPLVPWRIVGVRAQQAPALGKLVGRADERREFAGLIDGVMRQRGRVVVVRGDPGVGKSRLVAEFRTDALRAGVAVHAAAVLDFGAQTGRDAVRTLARGLLGIAADAGEDERRDAIEALATRQSLAADHRLFLHDLVDAALPPSLRPLADAMSTAARERGSVQAFADLVRLRAATPHALVVEDIHWADDWTLERLGAIAVLAAQLPFLVVMTTRFAGDPTTGPWRTALHGAPLLTLDLGPLGDAEARQLASSATPSLSPARLASCVERAEGNPLFLLQLLLSAGETTPAAHAALPGSIQALVHTRMDRLAAADKAALQAAAVLGQRWSLEALRHLVDDPGYDGATLVEHYLVRPDPPGYLFCHALIRDGAYASLLHAKRRTLHARAAEWFETSDAALAAEHFERAQHAKAPGAWLAAGQALARQQRYAGALRSIERGLTLAGEHGARFELLMARASLLVELVRPHDALEAARQALDAAVAGPERARALVVSAAAMRLADRMADGLAALDAAEPLALAAGSGVELSRLHHLRGNLLFPLGRQDECRAAHERALATARACGSLEAEAAALGGLGDADYLRGRMQSAHRRFAECVELARRHGFGRLEVANLPMVGWTGHLLGRVGESVDVAREAIELAVRAAQPRAELLSRTLAVCLETLVRARFDDAEALLEPALALVERLDSGRFRAQLRSYAAVLAWRRGERDRAVAEAAAALATCREQAMGFVGPLALGVCALVDPDRARRLAWLAEGEAQLRRGAVSHNHLWLRQFAIDVHLDLGEWDEVDRACARLRAYMADEPVALMGLFADRGEALARSGRGERGDSLRQTLEALRDRATDAEAAVALEGLDRALDAFA